MYHRDRSDDYGGVFVACREPLISCSLEIENNHCELVACQVKLATFDFTTSFTQDF